MRTVKILGIVVGGVIALIVVTLLAVWLLVNPNDYKGRIAAAVKQSTGRDLLLPGAIKLSIFPWVALELGPASLGNPPGFGAEPFLSFSRAAVRVKLLPLLSKRLEIGRVQLDGLNLRLIKNAAGTGNWENFGKTQEATPNQPGGTMPSLQGLEGISVHDGHVSYQNIVIDKLNLEVGAFAERQVVPVTLGLEANRGVPGEAFTLNAKFDLKADSTAEQFKFAAVSLSGLVSRAGDEHPAHWEMSAQTLDVDLKAQTLTAPVFALDYSGAKVNGKLEASKILGDMTLAGSVSLAPLQMREFMPKLGIALPRTRDSRALAQVSASSDFAYGAGGVKFDKMQMRLDDTTLTGSAALTSGDSPVLKFDLAVDRIDLDRYMSADNGAAAPGGAAAVGGTASGGNAAAASGAAAAKPLQAQGTLTLGAVHFSPVDFSNVRATVNLKDEVLHLFPFQAQIDGGSYSGNITLDAHGATPTVAMDEHLSGIDIARLLAGTSYKGRMSGRGNVNIKATARGAAVAAVMQSLNGHFDANLANGAIEGVDLGYELARAQALVKRESPPARSGPAQTKFDAFKMSAQITNGVAVTKDLTISSPVLRVTGQGSANLVNKGIDFQVLASILKSPGATMADIPMKITGTYLDPTVRPDVEALAKGQVKKKLQDVLQKNGLQGLKGLFGKP